MSRETVRAQVINYIQNAGIPGVGVGSVKTFPSKITPEGDFYLNETPGSQQGVIIFPYIENQREKRIEFRGATGGGKEIHYEFVFTNYFRSSKQRTEDAAADNEAFIDAFIAAIRASKNAGGTGAVFQWGEGSISGGEDIQTTVYYPRELGGASQVTQIVSTIRVTVIEITES